MKDELNSLELIEEKSFKDGCLKELLKEIRQQSGVHVRLGLMEGEIQLLDDATINQIAAGEVIESPSSVVKELVENALDAGATKIEIVILGGGLSLVRVTDNGKGMSCGDAKKSIERHATSKLRLASELFSLSTKGFRGEALASIASVSKMKLQTSDGKGEGVLLSIEGGRLLRERKAPSNQGTIIEVNSLFFNTLPRKAFQKSGATLSAQIYRLITTFSLCHPEVNFSLTSNGKETLTTQNHKTLKERAEYFLGKFFDQDALLVDEENELVKVKGVIAPPSIHKPNRLGQYLFINDRPVECPSVAQAILDGYGTSLAKGRYPVFVLHIQIPLHLVDVNVHPQKLQVRIRSEELVTQTLSNLIQKQFALLLHRRQTRVLQRTSVPALNPILPKTDSHAYQAKEKASDLPLSFPQNPPAQEAWGVFGNYLFLPGLDFLTIVDLQAASTQLIYNQLIASYEESKRGEKQGLLFPLELFLGAVEIAMILTHKNAIEILGFSLTFLGQTIQVEAIPPFLEQEKVEPFLVAVAQKLQGYIGKGEYETERGQMLSQLAASFAGKKKGAYSKIEAQKIYERFKKGDYSSYSSSGQKIVLEVADEQIKHLFRANQTSSALS